MRLTPEEEGIISIVRLNGKEKRKEIRRKWQLGRVKIAFEWRSSSSLWGRFGGGWQWKLGIQASTGFRTVIISLLICTIRISLQPKEIQSE